MLKVSCKSLLAAALKSDARSNLPQQLQYLARYGSVGKEDRLGTITHIHGPFASVFGSDIGVWRKSMHDLIALSADILCEGHYGVFRGEQAVREFIEDHLAQHP